MAGKIKGILVEIGGDTSGLQKSLKEVNSASSSLSKELKGINSLLKLDPKNTELLAQKQSVLTSNIKETEQKLKLLKEAQREADETIENGGKISQENYRALQREIVNTENRLKNFKNEASNWSKVSQAIEKTGDNIKKIGEKLDSVGNKVSVVSAGVGAGLVATTKNAIEFESAFTGVTKTVDGTEEQLKQLKNGILDMSTRMPASANEIAAVAESAGQLGIKTEDILAFTEVMINLGESTNLSADVAASSLAKFANITKMSAKDYEKLGSTIVDLGNNFATTEADIVDMATRLAATGELTGLTESQILALATAMSSVGIEAEAGGSAMSKLLKKIQVAVETGSGDLEDFAKVAGMTAKDFKKAFEKDSVGALSKFVKGLNDTERNGKSAIAILEDMDLKEVRLSNTILSLASASDVMTNAVNVANSAWKSNTALSEEAGKRYKTTESQIEMLKNEATKLTIEFGENLAPTLRDLLKNNVKPFLKDVSNWIKKFNELDDKTKENIVKVLGLTAAMGPLVKVTGNFAKIVGGSISGLSKFIGKIGEIKNSSEGLNGTLGKISTSISSLPTATGIAATAITIDVAAMNAIFSEMYNILEENLLVNDKVFESINETTAAYERNIEVNKNALDANMSEIAVVENLKNQLDQIVDSNGKVKEGYEERAKYITGQLSEAIGKEIDLNNGVIDSYDEIEKAIDDYIIKQKALASYNYLEEEYKNAVGIVAKAQKELDDIYFEGQKKNFNYTEEQKKRIEELNNTIDHGKDSIAKYNYATSLMADGTKDSLTKITNSVLYNVTEVEKQSESGLRDTIKNITGYMDYYKSKLEETGQEWYQAEIENQKNMLQINADTLTQMSSTINSLDSFSQDMRDSWLNLSTSSFEIYATEMSKLPAETQKVIQECTGVYVASSPQMQGEVEKLASKAVEKFDKEDSSRKYALETIQGFISGLNDDEKKQLLTDIGIQDVNLVLDELNKGNLSEEHGKNILNGLYKGLGNSSITNNIMEKVGGLVGKINQQFRIGWDIHSPSKLMQKYVEYYLQPITDVMEKREHDILATAKSLSSGINAEMKSNFNPSNLSPNQITNNSNRNIDVKVALNVYPQSFNEAEIKNICKKVNQYIGKFY